MAYARACVYAWDLSSRGLNRFRWKNSIESIRYFSFFFLRETTGRVKFSCVSCRSSLVKVAAKGKKSLGVMEQWCCGFVTIEETRMKEGERNNEINGKQGQ